MTSQDARIWVGGLPFNIDESEILKRFERFGSIDSVTIRVGRLGGPPFAFVQYHHCRDASCATEAMNQSTAFGGPIKVQMEREGQLVPVESGRGVLRNGKLVHDTYNSYLESKFYGQNLMDHRRDSGERYDGGRHQRGDSRDRGRGGGNFGGNFRFGGYGNEHNTMDHQFMRDGYIKYSGGTFGGNHNLSSDNWNNNMSKHNNYNRSRNNNNNNCTSDHREWVPERRSPRQRNDRKSSKIDNIKENKNSNDCGRKRSRSPKERRTTGNGCGGDGDFGNSSSSTATGDNRKRSNSVSDSGKNNKSSKNNASYAGGGGGATSNNSNSNQSSTNVKSDSTIHKKDYSGHKLNGKFRVTIENIPKDMVWSELRELGKNYVEQPSHVTYARTYLCKYPKGEGPPKSNGKDDIEGLQGCGMLEFLKEEDADFVVSKLNNKRIKGHNVRLKVYRKTSLGLDEK